MSQTTTIKVGESAKTITLPEGKALILTGSVGAVGVAYLLDPDLGGTNSLRSWMISAGALAPIGPYENTQKIHITCAGGSIAAKVCEAILVSSGGSSATKPATPVKPVLTALVSAISVAYTVPSDGGSAILEAQFLDINGVPTTLTTNPQTIVAAAGVSITGTVRFRNAIGWSDYSPQATAVVPTAPSVVPFSSTQAFTAGQQVIYAGGLYTFNSDHAAGNWSGADVTYNGQSGSLPLNTVGFNKPFGVVANFSNGAVVAATTSSPATSRGMKLEMEAPFTKIRVAQYQRDPFPTRGLGISVASTETDAIGTLSQAVDPIVAGNAYSKLRADSQYGFQRLTWAGGQRAPVQAPGGVSAPGFNYITNLSTTISDWADCQSVAPAVAGKRPMIVARFNRLANAGDSSSNIDPKSMSSAWNAYVAGNPLARFFYCPSVGAGDHVADPTLSKSAGSLYDPTQTTTGIWQNIAFAAEHGIPTRNFGGFGDSITEGYAWWQNAVRTLSTQKAPCYVVNFGCSTNKPYQYLALLRAQIRETNYLTDILIPSFGQNMDTSEVTAAYAATAIAELQEIIALCKAFKKRLYIWTAYSQYTDKFAGFPVCVAAIQQINDFVRANESSGYLCIDIAASWVNSTMIDPDRTHPGATAGIPYMTATTLPVLQKGQ